MSLKNILTSGFYFSRHEDLKKYRFQFINSMFFLGIIITSIAGIFRFSIGDVFVAVIDLSLSIFSFFLFMSLRKNKKYFDIISAIALLGLFIAYMAITLLLVDSPSRLYWFATLIIISFNLKDVKAGIVAYSGSIIAISLLYFIADENISLQGNEFITALLFYSAIAGFSLVSSIHQHTAVFNIKVANTKIKKQQKLLYNRIRTNSQTELPNEFALEEKLQTSKKNIILLTLKIDNFITLLNEYGQEPINKLIKKVSGLLRQFNSQNITLYHVQLDQFSFIVQNFKQDQDIKLAQSVKSMFENISISIDDIEISISFSIGIARGDSQKLIIQANSVLHDIMKESTNRYKVFVFDENRAKEQKKNIYWNAKIKEIISNGNLSVYYQPIICNKTEKISKYECLIRAIDDGKIVAPFFFLQAAKDRGMLTSITKVVIDDSFKLFANNSLDFSINITEDDLSDGHLIEFLQDKSDQYSIKPNRVFLEILENITSEKSNDATKQFEELKHMGFGIAIDDFGAEASNLSRLLTLDADIIKIDGQFIKHLNTDPNSIKIVEAIVSLSKKLGVKTVAEFVHNEEIFHIVKKLGVDYSQGYYFSPPLPNIQEEKISQLNEA